MASSLAIPAVLSPAMNASTSRREGAAKFSLNVPTDEVGPRGLLVRRKRLTIACLEMVTRQG
jgi:hypothetical protein